MDLLFQEAMSSKTRMILALVLVVVVMCADIASALYILPQRIWEERLAEVFELAPKATPALAF